MRELLIKLFNADWPDEFNATAFCLPDKNATAINDMAEFYKLTDKQCLQMAEALVLENVDLRYGDWTREYLLPIYTLTEVYRKTNNKPKQTKIIKYPVEELIGQIHRNYAVIAIPQDENGIQADTGYELVQQSNNLDQTKLFYDLLPAKDKILVIILDKAEPNK